MDSDQCSSESEDSASSSEDSLVRPTFIPREQRMTIVADQQKKKEELLKAEKRVLEEELRKTKSRAIVAESVRKASEVADLAAKDGYDSESGIPCEEEKDMLDQHFEVIVLYSENNFILLYYFTFLFVFH